MELLQLGETVAPPDFVAGRKVTVVQRKLAFERPRLRPNVSIAWRDHTAVLQYREQGCELAMPAEAEAQAHSLLELLAAGTTVRKLISAAPQLADQLPDLLEEL